MRYASALFLLVSMTLTVTSPAHASRILEICEVGGVRPNQIIGYGLVVGLNNTGDTGQSRFTLQSTAAMLRRLGATIDPSMIQTRNAAAVMVTATLPASAAPGTPIDVQVSSMGNARSLSGGTLLQTALYGGDRRVYAVAQGPVTVGGFSAQSQTGSTSAYNHLTAGRVPEGGIVERRVQGAGVAAEGPITLSLREPSFVTARRVVEAIDAALGEGRAHAVDSSSIRIDVPDDADENARVTLLAQVQLLDVEPEHRARVVIDERTGTVVVGANVRIREVAIAQGGLTIEIRETQQASQPAPLSAGSTVVTQNGTAQAQNEPGTVHLVPATASLSDVVAALNALGARPRDLITIFQALRTAGAIDAEIELQ